MTSVTITRLSRLPLEQQKGFSIIELMVGMTIGLLVILAVTGSIIFISGTQRTLSDASDLQQQANIIMRMIGYSLRQAGGKDLVPVLNEKFEFSSKYNGYAGSGLDVFGLEGSAGNPDTLRISTVDRVDPTNPNISLDTDCLGNKTAKALRGVRIDNQFTLSATSLMCLGSGNNTAQAVAIGVEDFQVSYGVASVGTNNTQNIRYYNANSVPDWGMVRAVHVCLRISTTLVNGAGAGSAVDGCDGTAITPDGKIRRVYKNTFFLRNSPTV